MLLSRCCVRWALAAAAGLAVQAGTAAPAAPAAAAPAQVNVTLVEPARFADAGYSHRMATAAELAQLQQALQGALQPLAERRLAPGDELQVQVLDVDLAGELQTLRWPTGSELRVMRDITWPRIALRYSLRHQGREVAGGEQRLSDLDYLSARPAGREGERYDPERRLMRRWFEQTFGPAEATH